MGETDRTEELHRPVGRPVPVPYLELVAGGAWWTAGSAALDAGVGTVVLAAGLGATGALFVAVRRRQASRVPLPPGGRARLLRLGIAAAVLIFGAGAGLGAAGFGQLMTPVSCALFGAVLVPMSSLVDRRSVVAAGGALMVLGAAGTLLALDAPGRMSPGAVVGLVAGLVLWLAGAVRTGLLAELRDRAPR